MMLTPSTDAFTARMFEAVNGMMLDMLAAVARKDYEDRRRRQVDGIKKAKTAEKYRGRPEDVEKNKHLMKLLESGTPWSTILASTGVSRSTLARLTKRLEGVRASREGHTQC
jgi:DNA invertase Pin-like site-specific DNA recombinase